MAASPKSVAIRSYNVGFGDCFLLSFDYGEGTEKHVLIDFGSTRLPPDAPKTRMMDIAEDIKTRTGGKLAAVVATHRHKDHLSGFATKNGKGTGDIIRDLKPKLVIQPWTEDPDLPTDATAPKGLRAKQKIARLGETTPRHLSALKAMHRTAEHTLALATHARHFPSKLRRQLSFLGENNIQNASAVKNLMSMARNAYVHAESKSGLERLLPGVKVHVLGPPTVKQHDGVKKQRARHPDEFWHLQARAMALGDAGRRAPALFPRYIRGRGTSFPVETRWLIQRAGRLQGEQLLSIVRILDKAMNNTSVILLFDVNGKKLLFPGDAQIENWEFALSQKKYAKLLSSVNLYKVGHHGSLNATPKTLWNRFKNRSAQNSNRRLRSLMSTMKDVHGHEDDNTEVPRRSLVTALKGESEHFSTQQLLGPAFFKDTVIRL